MIEIDFNYEGNIITIQQNTLKVLMKDIYSKFCQITSLNAKLLYFLYDGKIIDDKLSLDKIIKNEDRKRNKMNFLVVSMKDKYSNEKASQIKA